MLGVVSRQRLGLLRHCLNSAIVNAGDVEFGATVVFDDDIEGYLACPEYPWLTKKLITPRHYYVRSVNTLISTIMEGPLPDYIVSIDDDTEFIQTPWAEVCVSFFDEQFPDGLGLMDLLSHNECGQLFTTPAFVKQMGGLLHDPAYLQFYADTDLRRKVGNRFIHLNSLKGRPFFVHKRDFSTSGHTTLSSIKTADFKVFKARAAANNWDLYEA